MNSKADQEQAVDAVQAIDANAELRHPLTVLVCILPMSILGELYRWVIIKKESLLVDEIWHEIGHITGVLWPIIPPIILGIGCILWMFISKKQWVLPTVPIFTRVFTWAIIWCLVRSVISFTNAGLHTDSVGMLGQIGLCVSGAVQEEIIFRGIGIGVAAWIISLIGIPLRYSLWIFLPISALLFSLAHTHVMNSSLSPESWNTALFIEHTIAGLIYGYAFIRQGLAVACLSHFFFNLLIILQILSGF